MFCSAWYTASTLSSMLSCFSSMESLEMSNRATLLPADSLALKVSLHTTITCAICSETCTISVCICCNLSLMAPRGFGGRPRRRFEILHTSGLNDVQRANLVSFAFLHVLTLPFLLQDLAPVGTHGAAVGSKNFRMSHSLSAMRAILGLLSSESECKNSSWKLRRSSG